MVVPGIRVVIVMSDFAVRVAIYDCREYKYERSLRGIRERALARDLRLC